MLNEQHRLRIPILVACLAILAVAATACDSSISDPTVLAIRDVALIDATAPDPRPDMTVLVRGEYIERVEPSDSMEVPGGARVVEGRGRYLIPGLWDMHVHLSKAKAEALPLLVASGVTSVRDMGSELAEVREWQVAIHRGELIGPRIVTPGPMLDSPDALERLGAQETWEDWARTRVPVPTVEAAGPIVDSIAGLGVDFIKIREAASSDIYRAVAEAARARGIPLAGHPPYALDPVEGAGLGLASFEHGSYPYPMPADSAQRRQVIRAFLGSGIDLVPTLTAWQVHLMDRDSLLTLARDSTGRRDPRMPLLSENLRHEWRVDVEEMERKSDENLRGWMGFFDQNAADIAAFHDAGVPVLPGSDLAGPALFPGHSLHTELELLVDHAGLTPAEAIAAATRQPAELLSMADSLGTIEPGKIADLVLLEADPLADIVNTRRIAGVILRGRYLDASELRQIRGGLSMADTGTIELLQSF